MLTTPRQIAFEALQQIEFEGAYVNLITPELLSRAHLNHRDAGFVTELVHGTVRMQRFYDAVIDQLSSRPTADIDPDIVLVLRLGIHQLLSMRVSDHAAVDESVHLAHQISHAGTAKFVNALLRNVVRNGDIDYWKDRVRSHARTSEAIGKVTSHPDWIVRAYRDTFAFYGLTDDVETALQVNNMSPYIHLVARPGLTDRESLADSAEEILDCHVAYTPLSPYGIIISSGDPARLPAIQDTAAAVQDQGSQLVARIFAETFLEGEDAHWLDLCAGPGGKTALAAAIAGTDKHITAVELHPHRADLIEKTCKNLPNVTTKCADGITVRSDRLYDRILIDAPCSGLGTMNRRADVRWKTERSDIAFLVRTQQELLDHACDLVRPGGRIVYSTCTPHLSETVDVVRNLHRFDMVIEDARQLAQSIGIDKDQLAGQTDFIQLWPHRNGCEAMFCAVLTKK
ncbi:MAG: transcription antitermination factor NusB [Actinomycetaceae bacterium]|nr:transcription antitermination factor NusB [Actinomycetaceae bacterium]